ncbi:MAG: S8/S53 family peptidase [bacterium]
MKFRVLLFCLLLGCFVGSALAGQIPAAFQSRLNHVPGDSLVSVWIELAPAFDGADFKKSSATSSTLRQERYRLAVSQLRSSHQQAQENLVNDLTMLQRSKQVGRIRPHWLVNVIEAEVAANGLPSLAARADVLAIRPAPSVHLLQPEASTGPAPKALSPSGVQNNLQVINADDAWAAGYTGAGRLVCSFDTGVEGDHPALTGSWRGNDGNHAAAWFFPRQGETGTTPRQVTDCYMSSCNSAHGTHTMGIMVGHDDVSGDTVGVALDAEWISAAVIDIDGTSIIDAFEWAADPDGDPNTVHDLPDVINHSWGVDDVECQEIFYDLIDYTEALGIVNIFAAGNDGGTVVANPNWRSIRNPADRALDSIDCFAVGNVNHTVGPPEIYVQSSRGPSTCTGGMKPNVSAPGFTIYSSIPGHGYLRYTGTSMAAPHVSGLVALLRQKNPNATVDQIKTAILTSANQYSYSLPDSSYGWGVIDCMAALNAILPDNAEPNVRLYSWDHAPVGPGDTVEGTVVLQNLGTAVSGVGAVIIGSDPSLTVLAGSATLGSMDEGDTARSAEVIRIVVSDTVTCGRQISLPLLISGDGGYSTNAYLHVKVAPDLDREHVTHNAGRVQFTVSNYGTYGMGRYEFFSNDGVGFVLDDGSNLLWESGLVVATDDLHISDGIHNTIGEPDQDFRVAPGGNITLQQPGENATQQTYSIFDDSRAENPIGLSIEQHTYSWAQAPYDNFVILRYVITNTTLATLHDVKVGLFADWDVAPYQSNRGGYDEDDSLLWTAYYSFPDIIDPRAIRLLDGPLATAWTGLGSMGSYPGPTNPDPEADGLTEAEKWSMIDDGLASVDFYKLGSNDLMQLLAAGPFTLAPGQAATAAFAMVGGTDWSDLITGAEWAAEMYKDSVPTDVRVIAPATLPDRFTLHQNYPNPFNPSTVIAFDLPRAGAYDLTVYNVLGQNVHHVSGRSTAGRIEYTWDASGLASGIYLYQVTTDHGSAGRKMLLLK